MSQLSKMKNELGEQSALDNKICAAYFHEYSLAFILFPFAWTELIRIILDDDHRIWFGSLQLTTKCWNVQCSSTTYFNILIRLLCVIQLLFYIWILDHFHYQGHKKY